MYNPQQSPFPGGHAGPPGSGPYGNSSGMGGRSELPPEARGWNWGAFLLHLFWGIGNNTWIALLMLVPFVNWVMPFVLLAKGNQWAWQNRRWIDVAHFKRVQRRWAIAGVLLWLLVILATAALPLSFFNALRNNPVQELALTAVRTSPEAVTVLGSPIEKVGSFLPSFNGSLTGGLLEVTFDVAGPRGSASVTAQARETGAGWDLLRVTVRPSGSGVPMTVLPRQRL